MKLSSAVHNFSSLDNTAFKPADYSKLKFGCDDTAKKFGTELAQDTFAKHANFLLGQQAVVIPSAYNYVRNAASVMTSYFIDELNHLLVENGGQHVEHHLIHRKVSYVQDYGFLSREKREELIANDKFSFDKGFCEGKLLIFTDDVKITGTHERKVEGMMQDYNAKNDRMYLYYANYTGDVPQIEAQINFAGVRDIHDYISLAQNPNHNVIVRPIKYVLSRDMDEFSVLLEKLPKATLIKIYKGALAEGYYNISAYTDTFAALKNTIYP